MTNLFVELVCIGKNNSKVYQFSQWRSENCSNRILVVNSYYYYFCVIHSCLAGGSNAFWV